MTLVRAFVLELAMLMIGLIMGYTSGKHVADSYYHANPILLAPPRASCRVLPCDDSGNAPVGITCYFDGTTAIVTTGGKP